MSIFGVILALSGLVSIVPGDTKLKFWLMDSYDYMMYNSALASMNNSLANSANIIIAAQTSKQDRKFSREMSDLAWKRNLESWNMNNEYNLPINQYQRQLEGLQANGLNPNLVYGNSSAVSGAAGSVAPYRFDGYHSTAVPQFRGFADPVQSLYQTQLLQTQVEAQQANNRLINARADNEEARNPGIVAHSDEAAQRWQYILNHMDDQESAWRAQQALEYWKGQQSFSQAEILKNKASISYFEAAAAEWLNTTNVPGLDLTYRQYMDMFKSMIPAAEFEMVKKRTLDIVSQTAYRDSMGEMLDLKKEYQRALNKFAYFGRGLSSDWLGLIMSGLIDVFGDSPTDVVGGLIGSGPVGGLYNLGKKRGWW